jgi:hypothetical protein
MVRGERVYLRPAERSGVPTLVRWFTDADVMRHLDTRAPMSEAGEERWFGIATRGTSGRR